MQNIDLSSSNNYNDYVASAFFHAYGLKGIEMTKKEVETRDGAKVALVSVAGYNPIDGHMIAIDLWPNKCQTLDDIKAVPDTISDVVLRFGKYTDEETGETHEADKPRIAGVRIDGKWYQFHGNRPEWDEEAQRSIWNNDAAETADAEPAE